MVLTGIALDKRVSDEGRRAAALRAVVHGHAVRVRGARAGRHARVDAASVQTGVTQRAVIVAPAAWFVLGCCGKHQG